MKNKTLSIITSLICVTISFGINTQSVIGAWEGYQISDKGEQLKNVVIFSEEYQVLTTYHAQTGKFIHSNGGTWKLDGNRMTEKAEFNSDILEAVGKEVSFDIVITDSTLSIVGGDMLLKKIDNGWPGALQGACLVE